MKKFINAVNSNPEAKKELTNWGLSFAENAINVCAQDLFLVNYE